MRLVIEREGGFDVIEDHEAITRIDVQSYGVKVTFVDDTGGEWSEVYPVADHAAACRLSAAIAVRCGVLVEPLAVQEELEADGLEDAADDDAMGAVMAGRKRKNSALVAVQASAWVAGEPPKGGLWYVVARAGAFGCVAWDGSRFRDWYSETVVMDGQVAHLPTSLPPRR